MGIRTIYNGGCPFDDCAIQSRTHSHVREYKKKKKMLWETSEEIDARIAKLGTNIVRIGNTPVSPTNRASIIPSSWMAESAIQSTPVLYAIASPAWHRQREQQFMAHMDALLDDRHLRLDTTRGSIPVNSLVRHVTKKRITGPSDPLRSNIPHGEMLSVDLYQKQLVIFKAKVGRLQVVCVSPNTVPFPKDGWATPMDISNIDAAIKKHVKAKDWMLGDVALNTGLTIIIMSTSGFTENARAKAGCQIKHTDDPISVNKLILVEPSKNGGWMVWGADGMSSIINPESSAEQRGRLQQFIQEQRGELLSSGLAADIVAKEIQVPLKQVEFALKSYAIKHPGIARERLDGHLTIFPSSIIPKLRNDTMLERIKAIFTRTGNEAKKLKELSKRKALVALQRDRLFGEVAEMEQRETEMRQQFKDTPNEVSRRRLTGQLLQYRKDIERGQQLLGALGQQVNILGAAMHNVEMIHQGHVVDLPSSESLATDAAKVEEIIAEIEACGELADSVTVSNGVTDEEDALYKQLEQDANGQPAETKQPVTMAAAHRQVDAAFQRLEDVINKTPQKAEPLAG